LIGHLTSSLLIYRTKFRDEFTGRASHAPRRRFKYAALAQ
jgi:hypothetical protein